MSINVSELKVGDTFEEALVEDLKRTQLVMYAGASGDYNPLHTDEVYTKDSAGYPTVFAHGMLTMGMTGRLVTNAFGGANVKKFGVRFTNQVWPGDSLTAKATVADIQESDGQRQVELKIETVNQDGKTVITGTAIATIP